MQSSSGNRTPSKKEKNKEFEEIKKHLHLIIKNIADGVTVQDTTGNLVMVNEVAAKSAGYASIKAMLTAPLFDYIHKFEITDEYGNPFPSSQLPGRRALNGEKKPKVTVRYVDKKTRKIRWVIVKSSVIRGKHQQPLLVVNIMQDITERKETEIALRKEKERLLLAQEAGEIGIFEWDILNNKIVWSKENARLYGGPKNELTGTYEDWIKHVYDKDKKKAEKYITSLLEKKKKLFNFEFRVIKPDKTIIWMQTKGYTYYDGGGKPHRMIGINIDITQRKKVEKQKDEFMGIVSHELKTPVTSIKAFTQVLQNRFAQEGNEKATLLLNKMDMQINKLTGLIQDLLDVTKIEGGKLTFNETYFFFDEVVDEIIEEVQRTTKHEIVKEGTAGKTVFGDRDRIGQVITNLLTNAIKYSPRADSIIVQSDSTKDLVTLCVQDFGVGIPKEKQKNLFERFYRVEAPTHATVPGIGLGLYIASEIIKREKGKIWVDSEQGKGSTFCFILPIRKDEKTK